MKKILNIKTILLLALSAMVSFGAFAQNEDEIARLKAKIKELEAAKKEVSNPRNGNKVETIIKNLGELKRYEDAIGNVDRNAKYKIVTVEMPLTKAMNKISLDNSYRNVEIKVWNESKMKITAEVIESRDKNLTDEEYFTNNGITWKEFSGGVKIKSLANNSSMQLFYSTQGVNGSNYYYNGSNATGSSSSSNCNGCDNAIVSTVPVISNSKYNFNANREGNGKAKLIIWIPKNTNLRIDNKYSNINLEVVKDLQLNLVTSNVDATDVETLSVEAKYSNLSFGSIGDGEADITNGSFMVENIGNLDLTSKYADIEITKANTLAILSTNDEISIEEVSELSGSKNYGNIAIRKLLGKIDLNGTNADVKIKNLEESVSLVKIYNKYATVKLPLKQLKNYQINFSGGYSTINAPFEIEKSKATTNNTNASHYDSDENGASVSGVSKTNSDCLPCATSSSSKFEFEKKVGNTTGKFTKFDLKCSSCTVDFR